MAEPAKTEFSKEESLTVDEDRRRAYLAREAKPRPATKRRLARREKSWVDFLYKLNKVAVGKYVPHAVLNPVFKAIGVFFGPVLALPGVRKVHPWVRGDLTSIGWLPVAEDVKVPEGTPMPLAVLDLAIETASHRVIMDYCFCRKAGDCEQYPHDTGCLLMGDQPIKFMGDMGGIGREVGIEEAKTHARKGIAQGLVPVFGKARADCYLFGFKDRARLLATCFCCECCCISRFTKAWDPETLNEWIPRLEGATIGIDEALCDGCGKCVQKCYTGGVELKDGKAVNTEKCRICGRCTTVCSRNAIEITMTDPYWLDKTFDRILAYCEFREGH